MQKLTLLKKLADCIEGLYKDIVQAIVFASSSITPCNVSLNSALELDKVGNNFDMIITDPPYMDDVQYAELSDFFYTWLYPVLQDFYPQLPSARTY